MNIGLSMPLPAYKVNAAFMGSKAEELGFESIWYAEHPVMPVTTTSKFPGNESGEVPWTYSHFADPFIALAQASGATSKIKLATGIALIPERNPLVLAKTISTLDLFSGGRVLLGIGAGWHREETEMMGGDFDHRWTQTKESILAMKEMWTKDEAEFHGKYYDFPPVRMFPKPMQKPHPPVILGGMARNVFKRIIEWGDGWMPNRATPAMIETGRGTLTELAIEAGRDPDSISITIYGQQPDLDVIRSFHDAGANRVVVSAPLAEDETEMSRHLEGIADAVFK
ncbi:MAG: LLM class F420-dependent oxidoreductase [SAR202 cluster bacterium]|jgi:probable F420-dependent oxidoreductase|nr:LLM class F420-dependent oxidoreductase [SAR202 cluster bacterium]